MGGTLALRKPALHGDSDPACRELKRTSPRDRSWGLTARASTLLTYYCPAFNCGFPNEPSQSRVGRDKQDSRREQQRQIAGQ